MIFTLNSLQAYYLCLLGKIATSPILESGPVVPFHVVSFVYHSLALQVSFTCDACALLLWLICFFLSVQLPAKALFAYCGQYLFPVVLVSQFGDALGLS